jgi:hypothetical protein
VCRARSQNLEPIRRGIKRADVRENLLGVLPLIRDHFASVAPDFVQGIDRRYYSIGRGLMVPFDPPLLYGTGGKLTFPWFSRIIICDDAAKLILLTGDDHLGPQRHSSAAPSRNRAES